MAAADELIPSPALSVVMPTFNNLPVLQQAIAAWQRYGGAHIEVLVIEDGCRDSTAAWLTDTVRTPWGRRHLRWFHESDAHELRCTNRGIAESRAPLIAAFQDDMFLEAGWFVPELISTFAAVPELGLLSLSRGLLCHPDDRPIQRWEDLWDWQRLESTIGKGPLNWVRLQEVDAVIRPWVVRRACVDAVGALDDAFVPTEWDEADLAFRIRAAGWAIAAYGYERAGAYFHLGSTTIGTPSDAYKARVLKNGRLFHDRWDAVIDRERSRVHRTWSRVASVPGWTATALAAGRSMIRKAGA